jgi:hypothetical protein
MVNVSVEARAPAEVVLPPEDIKELSPDQVIVRK